MNSLLVLLGLFAALGLIAWFFKSRLVTDEPALPYYPKKPLSEPEQVLYHRLVKALPEHIVLAQVQASRILGVKPGHSFAQRSLNRLSLDFVVCLKDATVVAAIELDDPAQDRPARQAQALRAAEVPLIRWPVDRLPDEAAIQAALRELRGDAPGGKVIRLPSPS